MDRSILQKIEAFLRLRALDEQWNAGEKINLAVTICSRGHGAVDFHRLCCLRNGIGAFDGRIAVTATYDNGCVVFFHGGILGPSEVGQAECHGNGSAERGFFVILGEPGHG